jgi:hypothetical protein
MSSKPQPRKSGNFLDDYRSVNERIREFYAKYPTGRILTNIVESLSSVDAGVFVVRAELYRNDEDNLPFATGLAIETPTSGYVNKQGFALENSETSSIGRALQNAGIVTKASELRPEEIERINRVEEPTQAGSVATKVADLATPKQLDAIRAIAGVKGLDVEAVCWDEHRCKVDELSKQAASDFLESLRAAKIKTDGVAPRSTINRDELAEKAKRTALELRKNAHPDFKDGVAIKMWLRSLAKSKWAIQINPDSINSADDLPDDLLSELPKELEAELKAWNEKQAAKSDDDQVF